jgi:hypothetical protein
MMIDCPEGFSDVEKAAVENAIAEAEGDFEEGFWSPLRGPHALAPMKDFHASTPASVSGTCRNVLPPWPVGTG